MEGVLKQISGTTGVSYSESLGVGKDLLFNRFPGDFGSAGQRTMH